MALYDAFVEMNNGKKSFAEKKDKEKDGPAAVKFLNEYFGEDKVFAPAKLDDDVKQEINQPHLLYNFPSKLQSTVVTPTII